MVSGLGQCGAVLAEPLRFEPIGGKPSPVAARWVAGKFGKGIKFANNADAINCGHSSSLDITNTITITFWINGETWNHTAGFMGKRGVFEIKKRLTGDASGVYFDFVIDGQSRNVIWDAKNHMKLKRGEWQHIAIAYDSRSAIAKAYLNGRLFSSRNLKTVYPGLSSYEIAISKGDLLLGSRERPFHGALDDVYIFRRVLSDEEIAKLYRNEQISRSGLVGLWQFEEGKGTETADLSGYGNVGRLSWQFDQSKLPMLGGEVDAQVLHTCAQADLWFQNATAKVMHGDKPAPRKPDPSITVSLARNEAEPFQLVITPKTPIRGVSVKFSNLKSGKYIIPKKNISWNSVQYVPVDEPSNTSLGKVPGGEVPIIYTQKSAIGWYPDPLPAGMTFDITENRNYPLWVTIRTTKDTLPGIYKGKMTITGINIAPITLALNVRVWSFCLPEVFHTWNQAPFSTKFGAMNAKKAARNLAEHHFSIQPIMTPPVLTFKGTEAFIDTADFDTDAAYLIDELKMNNFFFPLLGLYFHPDARKSMRSEWRGFVRSDKLGVLREDYVAALTSYIHKMSDHLRDKGWFDKFRVSLIDEPQTPEDFAIIRQLSRAIKMVEPKIKIYETKWPRPELIGDVDIWCLTLFQPRQMKAALERGESLEWYPNWHPLIDRPGMNTRMIGWTMWKYHVTGILLFDTQHNWYDGDTNATWFRPCFVYSNGRIMWGMGCLFYPADDWSIVNSIRWELLRETFEDYEYLYLLDSLCRVLSTKRLFGESATVLQEARDCLGELPGMLVPYYEADESKEKWRRMEWEINPNKVYEAREKIATHIERLSQLNK